VQRAPPETARPILRTVRDGEIRQADTPSFIQVMNQAFYIANAIGIYRDYQS